MFFNKNRISKGFEFYTFVLASISTVAVLLSKMQSAGLFKEVVYWVFGTSAFICWACWLYEIINVCTTGYRYGNEEIVIRKGFFENRISTDDIKSITLSVAYRHWYYLGQAKKVFWLWNYPWITLSVKEPCHLAYNNYHAELSGQYIDRILKADGDLLYGFAYNRDNKPDWIFKNYTGKIYITYSLIARYCDEFFEYIDHNCITKDQIVIIYDKGNYNSFPRKIDFNYVDSRIKTELERVSQE